MSTYILGINAYHADASAVLLKDEPIVCSPQDALHCFATTQMDALVLGNYLLIR